MKHAAAVSTSGLQMHWVFCRRSPNNNADQKVWVAGWHFARPNHYLPKIANCLPETGIMRFEKKLDIPRVGDRGVVADESAEIILIAPGPNLVTGILGRGAVHVRCFASVADFDAWRARTSTRGCLADLIEQLTSDRDATVGPVPASLQLALGWLGGQERVPPLKVFAEAACARRSFFRLWSRSMRERPGRFLDHLRALHAQELLAHGATVEDALGGTGCRSLTALHRLLERWH